jgi:hypothetical protein
MQPRRDAKRRAQFLVKNNLALDLKHSAAEVWLLGPAVRDLEKNNLAACKMFIFQPAAPGAAAPAAARLLSIWKHRRPRPLIAIAPANSTHSRKSSPNCSDRIRTPTPP